VKGEKTMIIELHLIQNFAPSNLNRDDTGSPKDCEFGGYRRARISSQCLKRSIRDAFKSEQLIDEHLLASRTKRLVDEVAKRVHLRDGNKSEEDARRAVEMILNGVKLTVKDERKTQYLLFLGAAEINKIVDLCLQFWEQLTAAPAPTSEGDTAAKKPKAKDAKKAGQEAVPKEIKDAMNATLNGGKAADLALFGRMLADLPDKNIDAASQVAHALSTNKVSIEFDFYTAVDDLRPEDKQGSDMLGTIEFNSACFYRYSNIDLNQLKRNLGGDEELAYKTVEAFLRASVAAIPTGKQNSMAAQNPPSFVLAVARSSGHWSLANAFVKPVRPTATTDLIEGSIAALDNYWGQLEAAYGKSQIIGKAYINLAGGDLGNLNGSRATSLDDLVTSMREAIINKGQS
jgi:CRISPR system Cascade subunit CasC